MQTHKKNGTSVYQGNLSIIKQSEELIKKQLSELFIRAISSAARLCSQFNNSKESSNLSDLIKENIEVLSVTEDFPSYNCHWKSATKYTTTIQERLQASDYTDFLVNKAKLMKDSIKVHYAATVMNI